MIFSRIKYYSSSLVTLLKGVENWPLIVVALLYRPARRTFVVRLKQHRLRFKVRSALDAWIIKETCLDREYEKASVALQDGWTVIDIGAGIGDFAIFAAKRFPNTRIFAFEPFQESVAMFTENMKLNGVENITLLPYAVTGSGREGVKLLSIPKEPAQCSTVLSLSSSGNVIAVAGWTLDQVFDLLAIDHCDFLKMDCEGAEYEILFGASQSTLRRIVHLCLEYHDGFTSYSHRELEAYLRAQGFCTRKRPNPVHCNLGLLHAFRE